MLLILEEQSFSQESEITPEREEKVIDYFFKIGQLKEKEFLTGEDEKKVFRFLKKIEEIYSPKKEIIIGTKKAGGAEVKVGGWVWSCQISPDGTFIIVGSDEDQTARLLEIKRDNQGKIIGI